MSLLALKQTCQGPEILVLENDVESRGDVRAGTAPSTDRVPQGQAVLTSAQVQPPGRQKFKSLALKHLL